MKILAIERDLRQVDWTRLQQILKDESSRVYELYQYNYIREIFFNENNHAVLILECDSREHAAELLATLPLTESGLVEFELMELKPYTGFSRLMEEKNNPLVHH